MSEHIPVFIYTFLACLSFCVIFKFHKIPHMLAAAAGGRAAPITKRPRAARQRMGRMCRVV